jgi:hypothetical protein
VVVIAAAVGVSSAGVTVGAEAGPLLFLEESYLAPLSPWGRGLLFEGQVTGHHFLHQGFAQEDWLREGGLRRLSSLLCAGGPRPRR